MYEPGWVPEEIAAEQTSDLNIGPIFRRKLSRDDRPMWEDISPESWETKIQWRQWERLFLFWGILHEQFHELEGHGLQYQLVIPEGRREDLMHQMHGGATGAHLGTTRTLVLLEHVFYWPGMRADVKRT